MPTPFSIPNPLSLVAPPPERGHTPLNRHVTPWANPPGYTPDGDAADEA